MPEFNLTWSLGTIPSGERGARATLAAIRRFARRDSRTPEIRLLALELTRELVPYDRTEEIRELHRFVRDEIRYVRDVADAETVQSPRLTLRVGGGDCDDKTALLASLLYSIGFPVRYVLSRTNPRRPHVFSHVYPEGFAAGKWFALETIIPGAPVGWTVKQYGVPYREA